jgi:Mor family transcriptional regulator
LSNGDEREKPASCRDDPIGRLADIVTGLLVGYLARATTIISSHETKRAVVDEIRRAHAGAVVRFGKGGPERRAARNKAMFEDIAAGASLAEVARRYHVSEGHVRRIMKRRA